jgi:hypothetical protein
MTSWKPCYKIVIEGDEFSFTAYNEEDKSIVLMYQNDAESFDKLLDFIYHTINGQTNLRKERH